MSLGLESVAVDWRRVESWFDYDCWVSVGIFVDDRYETSDYTEYKATIETHPYNSRGQSKSQIGQQRESSVQDVEDTSLQAMIFNEEDGLINEDDNQIFDTSGLSYRTIDEKLTA
ncbi:hypothetical protein BY996DRAFT_6554504 [Phakopsora pachyrhizi]|nr:hypothetical protein BY996DRAFT_6554504 [Phakopsora pachyrhizi]